MKIELFGYDRKVTTMLQFPETFAICRKQTSRGGPYWQLFQANKVQHHYEISTPGWERSVTQVHETFIQPSESLRPMNVWCKIANGAVREYIYWYLPIYVMVENENIPVIDFSYKAWLSRPTHRIPLTNRDSILRMSNAFEQRSMSYQLPTDQNTLNRFTEAPMRSPTPPRRRESEVDTTTNVNTSPPGGDPRFFNFQDISVAATSQNTRPLPIPDIVGSLLIRDAREGKESCPITATPYSELDSLSATSCFHVFDTESIKRWFTDQRSCPICRTTITNMITKEGKN